MPGAIRGTGQGQIQDWSPGLSNPSSLLHPLKQTCLAVLELQPGFLNQKRDAPQMEFSGRGKSDRDILLL